MSAFLRTPVQGYSSAGYSGSAFPGARKEGDPGLEPPIPLLGPRRATAYLRAFGLRKSAPSGGSVSTTDAGRPCDGSASATTAP